MENTIFYVLAVVALVLGGFIGVFIQRSATNKRIGEANDLARRIVDEARKEGQAQKKEILLQGQNEVFSQKHALETEYKEQERVLKNREKKLQDITDRLEEKMERVTQKEHDILVQEKEQNQRERLISEKETLLESKLDEQERRLQEVSGLTAEEAKARLFEEIESRTRHEAAKMMRVIETEAKETADRKAKEILACAIQRYAGDYVGEQTVTAVTLPSEDMKGRIIGREGRNIRTLETVTGVDLIIDDTPEAITVSSFDPVRREVARLALEKLIQDGRIHPTRIEDMVEKAKREVDRTIREEGERACYETGVHGLNPELVKILGRQKYRTSYGQNVLNHSIEVSHIAGLMASELGVDVALAKRAGLLHDLGKSIDHEVEGSHVQLGADLARKYKENPVVVNAIEAHHGDVEPKTVIAVLVQAADAVSAARPGARRENVENYIRRLQKLEELTGSWPGVDKAFAIQAGREVRIMVKPEVVTEDNMILLARDIAKKIEAELEYPGQIKVNVIRETKAVEYAK